jgi:ubiquinone/menaquinone biosynthesis C-methylase UbiE
MSSQPDPASNDSVYASGLLIRALDPATQPPEIRAFMDAEIELLGTLLRPEMAVLDVGCGTGRHLHIVGGRVRFGLGVDYEWSYVADANRRGTRHVHFVVGDATRVPVRAAFDFALCLTNTFGTMADQPAVLREMRRCAPRQGTRLVSVFSERSVPARREWYARFGHPVADEAPDHLTTEGGLRSEHFTEARLRSLIGDCTIRSLAGIAYAAIF